MPATSDVTDDPQVHTKDKPTGFDNTIKRVAIVGAGGTVGFHIATALIKTGKHTVSAISRKDSSSQFPHGVNVVPVDYNDESALIAALHNQQFLIITMAPTAPRNTHSKLVQAAAKAGVPYVMPNGYAGDIQNTRLGNDILLGPISQAQRAEIESLGMKWITVCCGFWYDYSLAGGESRFGFDFDHRTITFYDQGETRITTTTLSQVGRAVAAVLSLQESPNDENDTSLTLSSFLNRGVYIKSFTVSQRDIFDSVKRVTKTSDVDWKIRHEPSRNRYDEGMVRVKTGDMTGFSQLLYARAFYPGDASEFGEKVQNTLLELEEESLDEATRDGIELVEVLKGRAERMAA